jgi:cytochrome c-type biogenesis protein CcmF
VEATSGRQVTVGGPYFRRTTVPLLLLLLFLAGVGPLLPWRSGSAGRLTRRLRLPLGASAALTLVLAVGGLRSPAAVAAFGLATFVGVANLAEIGAGLRVAARTGSRRRPAALGALLRGRRRYGGLLVHVGLALAALAITASSTLARQTDLTLSRGTVTNFAGYTLRYEGMRTLRQPQRTVLVTDVGVAKDGRDLGQLHPSLNLYPSASEPIGTPSIRTSPLRDLYASVVGVEQEGELATFRFFLNPGVTWLWVGGAVMVLGGLLAVWPARRPPMAPRPAVPPARRREPAVVDRG